jgi:uncharacterized membrane protein
MDDLIEKIIFLGIGVALLFYSLAYVIVPSFTPLYEHCGVNNPYSAGTGGTDLTNACCQTGSNTLVACTNCNQSSGYSSFLSTCGSLVSTSNNTHCYQCSSFGNKGIYQGLFFLIFLIMIFSFVLLIVYYAIKNQ